MTAIPENPDALLPRNQAAAALTEAGYPISPARLSTKATRGGGPPFRLFGRKPLYRWRDTLAWAESRLSPPRRSTSEADAAFRRTPGLPTAETELAMLAGTTDGAT
jgi:hypothetical protein